MGAKKMRSLGVRCLQKPTIVGRTRALAIKGNSRFARVANMTGKELLRTEIKIKRDESKLLGDIYSVAAGASMIGSVLLMATTHSVPGSIILFLAFWASLDQAYNYLNESSQRKGGLGSVERSEYNEVLRATKIRQKLASRAEINS